MINDAVKTKLDWSAFLLALALALALASPLQTARAEAKPALATDEISAPDGGGDQSAAAVAKQLANPVAALISVPLQSNYDMGYGPNHGGERYTMNLQPVVPIALGKDWLMISRTILPFIYQQNLYGSPGGRFGIGDITQSLFFSPTTPQPGGIIWGAGPVFLIPTGSAGVFSSEQPGAGPTVVLLKQDHGLTYGVLANHIWGFAGNDARADVDSTFIQPFISYTTKTAFTAGLNMESTYDWNADQWTIPINLQFSQVVKIGGQLMSIGIGGRSYVERPAGGPDWGARFTLTFLFPEAHK